MVLDRKLREIQPPGYLFICQALCDKRKKLLLVYRKTVQGFLLNPGRRVNRSLGHKAKECKAQPGRAHGFPTGYGADGGNNVACWGVTQQVTRDSRANRCKESLFVVLHIDQHDTYPASRLKSIEETGAKERHRV
jgi:hypothetical protein